MSPVPPDGDQPSRATLPTVSAVVLAYGEEGWLVEAVEAVLASTGVAVDVVLVDNGCTGDGVERLRGRPGLQVVTPGANLGFAGGVDEGARLATGTFLAMVNSDAVVSPGALAALAAVAGEPAVGVAMGSIRLADHPELMNTAGNPLHLLGLAWAGGFGDPASAHQQRVQVPCASGAAAVLRHDLWRELGGFAPEYFAYHEDVELSWRCRQRGLSVEFVPDAVVVHHYEFSRTATKHYLMERNRLVFVLTAFELRTLLLLAPVLLAAEAGLLLLSLAQGWWRQKLAGWRWVLTHSAWLRARRRLLQGQRTVGDRELSRWLTARFEPGHEATPAGAGVLGVLLSAYWSLARRLL